jgi:hypothetical protein
MADGPEQAGEGVMLEEVWILKEGKHKRPLGDEEFVQFVQVRSLEPESAFIILHERLCRPIASLGPLGAYGKMCPELVEIEAGAFHLEHQACARLAEECPYDHVELLHHGLFFTLVEKLLDDDRYEQDLNGHEHDVEEEVKEKGLCVSEKKDVEKTKNSG